MKITLLRNIFIAVSLVLFGAVLIFFMFFYGGHITETPLPIARALPTNMVPQYPHALNPTTTIKQSDTLIESFDTADSADDVLCFYKQELQEKGWSEDFYRHQEAVTTHKCPNTYVYYQYTGPPLIEGSPHSDHYLFEIKILPKGNMVHVSTMLLIDHNGLR